MLIINAIWRSAVSPPQKLGYLSSRPSGWASQQWPYWSDPPPKCYPSSSHQYSRIYLPAHPCWREPQQYPYGYSNPQSHSRLGAFWFLSLSCCPRSTSSRWGCTNRSWSRRWCLPFKWGLERGYAGRSSWAYLRILGLGSSLGKLRIRWADFGIGFRPE